MILPETWRILGGTWIPLEAAVTVCENGKIIFSNKFLIIQVALCLIRPRPDSNGMDTLAKLFGGSARVKVMRLFLLNDAVFELEEVMSRSRISRVTARKEINALMSMGFLKNKFITKEGSRGSKKKVQAWFLDPLFQYLEPVRDLLVDPHILLEEDMLKRFRPIGKIKLMIVSGVFVGDSKSRIDILLVGDKFRKNALQQVIKGLEVEIGKELDYVVFDTEEFKYRLEMRDKLICDVLDLPHERLIDAMQLSTFVFPK